MNGDNPSVSPGAGFLKRNVRLCRTATLTKKTNDCFIVEGQIIFVYHLSKAVQLMDISKGDFFSSLGYMKRIAGSAIWELCGIRWYRGMSGSQLPA
ncbi:hypothetical protein [Emcibacter nanhaiensis]|uniref:Uncharacterized protein n=1 Tax=Emcibacter nanhaiensis TaxID=1505037 RepID=A0A501PN64_9PROT|nr:hypothetical protein [Emcibacter nanhaiensis]TPD61552.1 hypothetical protein FIV46_04910 [Emcibacter nanhaiensis]